MRIRGVIFDKDGTLFDFEATWTDWTGRLVATLAEGNARRARALAQALGYDPGLGRLRPGSVVIAGTPAEAVDALLPHLPPTFGRAGLLALMEALALDVPQVEAVPLRPLLDALGARGLRLGVVTNDTEAAARAHLRAAGVETRLHAIIGYDSGFGAKPAPGPVRAFAALQGLDPGEIVMVGDSPHDLLAGRAAGTRTIAVRSPFFSDATLAALADALLDDIGGLPGWLDG